MSTTDGARLRPSGYAAAAFACFATIEFGWLAEPQLAKQAKAGGARRDRTADLLHAMQALSQLSYGPVESQRLNRRAGNDPEPQFWADLKSLRRLRHHR